MNREEFSNEFDNLLNSQALSPSFGEHYSQQTIELSEYEKSLFLTNAQDEIVLSLYNGKNQFNEGFESTEELRRYVSSLVNTVILNEQLQEPTDEFTHTPLDKRNSVFYKLPNDVWFITYEGAKLNDIRLMGLNGKVAKVIPTRQDELSTTLENPFKTSNENKVLRLDISNNSVELISKYDIEQYIVRYIREPRPIILTTLPEPLTIKGESNITECELHNSLHRVILNRAVELALTSRGYTANRQQSNNQ